MTKLKIIIFSFFKRIICYLYKLQLHRKALKYDKDVTNEIRNGKCQLL